MKQLNVGVIGCGHIAQQVHIPNYVENSKSNLVAVCDTDKNVANLIAEKYKTKHVFTDYQELLKSGLVEAVSVCVPTSLHSRVVIDAARCGIHILCEKPLALNMNDADKMLEAASHNNIKLAVGFNLRFLSNHVKAKEYLDKGKIGRPIFAGAEVITSGPYEPKVGEEFYQSEAKKRIGCLFDAGAHLAYLLVWMLGEPLEVSASLSTYKEGVEVDDHAVVTAKFQNEVLGNIQVAWSHLPDYRAVENSRTLEIVGTEGILQSDCLGPSLRFYNTTSLTSRIKGTIKLTPGKFDPKIPFEALAWSYKQEIDDFLESIIKKREPLVSGEEGKKALRFILAAYESNRSQSIIKSK